MVTCLTHEDSIGGRGQGTEPDAEGGEGIGGPICIEEGRVHTLSRIYELVIEAFDFFCENSPKESNCPFLILGIILQQTSIPSREGRVGEGYGNTMLLDFEFPSNHT